MERTAKRQRVEPGGAATGPGPNEAADGGADAERGAKAQGGGAGRDDGDGDGDGDDGAGGRTSDPGDDDDGGGRCTICLDGSEEPRPIQRGCCCRGDGGLAHLACMVQLAAHKD